MKVKLKRLSPDAVIPTYAKEGDAGMDLTATRICDRNDKPVNLQGTFEKGTDLSMIIFHTDIAVEIPRGFVGLLFPRSSISKQPLTLANSVGIIDAGYRGEIQVRMKLDAPGMGAMMAHGTAHTLPTMMKMNLPMPGDKIAQLMVIPHPDVEWEEVEELSSSERGEGGFGSSNQPLQSAKLIQLDLSNNDKIQ